MKFLPRTHLPWRLRCGNDQTKVKYVEYKTKIQFGVNLTVSRNISLETTYLMS